MPRGWFTEEGMKLAGIWEEKADDGSGGAL